jgi:hypothetical protein
MKTRDAAARGAVSLGRLQISPSTYRLLSVLILAGSVITIYGLVAAPERTFLNLLLNGFYLLSLAVSGTFFIALQRLARARWSVGIRRAPEALMLILPVAAVLMLVVFSAGRAIYPWSHPEVLEALAHEAPGAGRVVYLQVPFVFARVATALVLWGLFAWLFRRTSLDQDRNADRNIVYHRRLDRYAGAFVVVFAPTFTLSAYDWIISLEPQWFSTMFAVYVFAGTFVQGIAAVTLTVALLAQRGLVGDTVKERHLHDLGKLLFAFATFWAYIWVCQYLLIWYGDLPEEVPYYVARTKGGWVFVFAANLVVNWVTPFVALLSARAKQSTRVLAVVSVVLLLGHWLDLYLLIMPSHWSAPAIGLVEVGVAVGCLAVAYLVFIRSLARAPLVPVNDPVLLAEKLAHAHAH